MIAEVIVVGGGPAGSVAALLLARAGVRVVLLDRSRFPRPKTCGEFQSPGATSLFARLGLLEGLSKLSRTRTRGLRLTGPGDLLRPGRLRVLEARYPGGRSGLGLERRVMDAALLEAARSAGARVLEGFRVTSVLAEAGRVEGVRGTTRGGRGFEMSAPLVIAADGRNSAVARSLGLRSAPSFPRRFALSVQAEGADGPDDLGEMHVVRRGYCGVAPLGDGRVNVSAVVPARRLPEVRREGADRFLSALVAAHPLLSSRLSRARFLERVTVLGPLAVGASRISGPGYLLVGDAAGFLDPFTGEGIHRALRSGEMAAEEAFTALEDGDLSERRLVRYERRHREEFRGKDRLVRTLARFQSSRVLGTAAGAVLEARPALLEALVAACGDCLPVEQALGVGVLGGEPDRRVAHAATTGLEPGLRRRSGA